MNVAKKLILVLAAGATLVAAAPVFADPGRGRAYDYNHDQRHYGTYDRHGYRDYNRGFDRRHVFVVRRPIMVERPVYYPPPAPVAYHIGPAAIIGAVIGGYIDHQR